jgi:hypothetical protein
MTATRQPKNILALLHGGDRRNIGRVDEVVALIDKNPALFPDLLAGLWSASSVIVMRAADAAEKVTRKNPALLVPHKKELLELLAEARQQELRWHLAVIVPRLPLAVKERQRTAAVLQSYLADRSSIVKTLALQGLADLAENDREIRGSVIELLREAAKSGTPAMRARSRKLLARMEAD